MIRLRRRRELSCEQVVALVTDYLDGALSRSEQARLEHHLAGCPHCTEYLAQIRATIGLTRALRTEDLTPQMEEHFLELYRRWSADEA
jgi:anti-sigma factor RsiW